MMPYSIEVFLTHYRLSLFLTAVTCVPVGVLVLVKRPRHAVHWTFAAFMVCVTVWSATQALIGTWPDPARWLLIAQIEHSAQVFIPTLFLHFVHALVGLRRPKRLLTSYVVSLLFFCLVPTRLLLQGIDLHAIAKFVLEPGPLHPLYMTWFIATVLEALVKLQRAMTSTSTQAVQKRKVKYIFWATVIGYLGGLPNFLYVYDIDVYPVNPFSTYLVPLYAAFISYAIVRHQVLDIRVVIRRSLVYSVLVGIITAVYFSFVLLAEKLLQGFMGYRSLIGSLVAGFVIAFGFTPLKELIQRVIDRLFFTGSQAALMEENERLRQAVAHSEKLKAVATLAAGLAHEIKNPLSSIKTFVEFLPHKCDDPAFREKFTKIVSQEVDRMNTLVQRLLEFAKPSSPRLQPVHLSRLITETVDFLHELLLRKQAQVDISLSDADEVLADPAQMKQVFLNILLNSLEAIEPSGRIAISAAQEDGYLSVIVVDSGRGIEARDLQRVFDPFYTTKPLGTGLGLSVVHSIVHEHGGHVVIQSRLGQGTSVQVQLPLNGGSHGTSTHPHCG
jgi:signal transduction histidine kinase